MNNLFNTIKSEIETSKSNFENIDSSTIAGMSRKYDYFFKEIQRLNNVLPEIINSFYKSNDLLDSQKQKIEDYVNNAMTDFITKSGVPGINPDYKVKI